ncbi:hypothetical protein COU15_01390 [Candidatus Kaiserbacteria bacterium CG10_big_fil_rev_8_21_14_0_10_45_20]|uniref:PKD domain-containing protein n=1 Tax=Candidatus Kaiserbacteria bacterium CG10_big_fil_rev_8_21_14_0_10_45_20 TaxID=1974607 RepID=A0A2H0UHZ7_9BACT|nr:MAG: hypothetical protein COU15_01390 [Candidatus Kaiserbacteria bacterium CG10_big_fil_rev_8_21_14_0_10_45_20]
MYKSVVVLFLLFIVTPYAFADHAVNINTADKEMLTTLTGIGDVKAQAIIDYRTQNGNFQTIEDIKNVSGIGEVTFNNIKDHITVSSNTETEPPPETSETSSNNTPPQNIQVDTKKISATAGGDRTVFAGADALFEGSAFGLKGEPLENARYIWTFGNGDRREGKTFFYNFPFPGTYVVVLDVASGKYSASDRIKVEVVPAKITIGEVTTDFIEIQNYSDVEIDLGGWMILANTVYFRFPQNTIVLAQEAVRISNLRTGLSPTSKKDVSILYPNGTPAVVYEEPLIVNRKPITTQSATSPSTAKNVTLASPNQNTVAVDTTNDINATSQVALPIAAPSSEKGSTVFPWAFGVFLVAISAIGGVFFIRRKRYSEYQLKEIE